jgi:hypothetical protein
VAVGQIDGHLVPFPPSWESCADGDFCLACRRTRAADAAQAAAVDAKSADRAKARRTALIEFEVRRTPDLTDGAIARACQTSAATVAAARLRLRPGDRPAAERR